MRRCLALAALLFAAPALAGPQDPWAIDPRASKLDFTASQVGAQVSGRLPTWTGTIMLDPAALAAARIDIRIEMSQVSTNNRDVDSLMKGPNFLDVLKFREARFVSTHITAKGGDRYEAQGKLTIRDMTRDVVLPFSLTIVDDPAQPGRVRATARGRLGLKRLDYGVGQNEWASTGQVSNEVTVDVTVVASRPR
ncbi:YceI family protein [Reyranella sp.]|uniref:YceI family protein n=1 Tax=Reyranella sp. TaxID=1929291 RepID=UPI003783E9CB